MKISHSKKKLREFSYIFGIGLPLLIGFLIPLIFRHEFRIWTIFIGLPVFLIGLFCPYKLDYFYRIWMRLGYLLGWINSRIILALVFFFVLQPISFFMKLFGYDPLRLTNIKRSTYRIEKKIEKFDLTRIF